MSRRAPPSKAGTSTEVSQRCTSPIFLGPPGSRRGKWGSLASPRRGGAAAGWRQRVESRAGCGGRGECRGTCSWSTSAARLACSPPPTPTPSQAGVGDEAGDEAGEKEGEPGAQGSSPSPTPPATLPGRTTQGAERGARRRLLLERELEDAGEGWSGGCRHVVPLERRGSYGLCGPSGFLFGPTTATVSVLTEERDAWV